MWSIICDAKRRGDTGIKTVAYANIKKTKDKWWITTSPELIMKFYDRKIAERRCHRFTSNNPRIVPFKTALNIILKQRKVLRLREREEKRNKKPNPKRHNIMPDCYLTQKIVEEEKAKIKQRVRKNKK